MAAPLFFHASSSARDRLTDTMQFGFIGAVGLWNLRWQVRGYREALGATNADLAARFANGTGVRGVDLATWCVDRSWDQQIQGFASLILTNQFAVYEGWCEEVLESLSARTKARVSGLQLPAALTKPNNSSVHDVLSDLGVGASKAMSEAFLPAFGKEDKKFRPADLENLLICYRYFKEVRNCLIHRDGIADDKAVVAYTEFVKVGTPASLGLKEVPQHVPLVEGTPVELCWRGVVGFQEVVLRLITTLDLSLASSSSAEGHFLRRWRHESKWKALTAKADGNRTPLVQSALGRMKLPATGQLVGLVKLLRARTGTSHLPCALSGLIV